MMDRTLDDIPTWLDETWLSGVLGGPVRAVSSIGRIGDGMVGMNLRLALDADPPLPRSVVVKLPSPDPTSRRAGFELSNYEREVRFYTELADTVTIRRPECLHASIDLQAQDFVLVLEDLAPAQQGDQVTGCSPDQARAAVLELVGLHAPHWGSGALSGYPWLSRRGADDAARLVALYSMMLPGFLTTFGDVLEADQRALTQRFAELIGPWIDARAADDATLLHGDYRLDNMLFATAAGGERIAVVDWQTPGHGPGSADVAYFLGAGVMVDQRRAIEEQLVGEYTDAISAAVGRRVDAAAMWQAYRRDAFAGVVMTVIASQVVGRTDRGDEMFVAMATRHTRHALDLDAASLLM